MMYNDQKERPDAAGTPDLTSDQNRLNDPSENDARGACRPTGTHSEIIWVRESGGGTWVYIDPAAGNALGVDAQTLLADPKALIRSVHPDDRESFKSLFDGRQDGEYGSLEYRIVLQDTTIRWMRARAVSVRDKDNRVLYVFSATVDITEQKSAVVARENEGEQRANFFSIASHELRTPLQPILGYLYLMLDNPRHFGLTEEGVQYLGVIQNCANRMSDIISKILVVSLADAEREMIQPKWETVSLEQLVADIIETYSTEGRVMCTVDIHPGQAIETDRSCLYEALCEICSNAVEHSSPPCHVVFGYAEEPGAHVISISDNGPGIDETIWDRIFQPFYIGDRDNLSRACGHLGLGLAIAKKDIETLGGTISVDSTLRKGSTFTVRLPKQQP